jgi:hypothetical protein
MAGRTGASLLKNTPVISGISDFFQIPQDPAEVKTPVTIRGFVDVQDRDISEYNRMLFKSFRAKALCAMSSMGLYYSLSKGNTHASS